MAHSINITLTGALLMSTPLQVQAAETRLRAQVPDRLASCPTFAHFDWEKLEPAWSKRLHWGEEEELRTLERHRQIRGSIPLPDLSRADLTLSLTMGSSEIQEVPTETSSFVWREAGEWQIDRVDYGRTWHVTPEPPGSSVRMDDAWQQRKRRDHHAGPLVRAKAAQIEQALADPCLEAQADSPPLRIPMKNDPGVRCGGGTGTTILIRQAATTRAISDPCGRWVAGSLMSAVMYGVVEPEHSVRQALNTSAPGLSDVRRLWWGRGRYPFVHVICGIVKSAENEHRFVYRVNTHGSRWRRELSLEIHSDTNSDFLFNWSRFDCELGAR